MDFQNEHPQRKYTRLKGYDYSSCGTYFVTICTHQRQCILSRVVCEKGENVDLLSCVKVEYSPIGNIALNYLKAIERKYPFVKVEKYMVMPNHIHLVLRFEEKASENLRRPTLMDVVCFYKTMISRECKGQNIDGKIFQPSFYEHIVRRYEDRIEIFNYISKNPYRWYLKGKYFEK